MNFLREIALRNIDLPWLNGREKSVLRHISDCHTERMGGNELLCECGNREVHYNSCRDRHCPLCQGAARAQWVHDRLQELLPVPYFHVVFTIPHELHFLARANLRLFYRVLFSCVHETLLAVSKNPANLGARIGGMSVLHTWNQKLAFHPHIHCIIPNGGASEDGTRWVKGSSIFLVSVKRLSLVFRGKLLQSLERYFEKGELCGDPIKIRNALRMSARKNFVVYAKRPFGGPTQVVKYLGRYTHRVGISEKRIISAKDGTVTFLFLDRSAGHIQKQITLSDNDFIHKFMLHVLPKGLRKIRYFGYMGNRDRTVSLEKVRALIIAEGVALEDTIDETNFTETRIKSGLTCSICGKQMCNKRPLSFSSGTLSLKDRLSLIRTSISFSPGIENSA